MEVVAICTAIAKMPIVGKQGSRGFTYVDGSLPTDDFGCQWCELAWVKRLQVLQQRYHRHQCSEVDIQIRTSFVRHSISAAIEHC